MTWKAASVDWFDTLENIYDTVEVYAKFEGNATYKPAVSKQCTFFVRETAYF